MSEAAHAAVQAQRPPIASRPVRALIVEDSRNVQAALEGLCLTVDNVEVVAIAAGEMEATKWILANPREWDIAVVDLVLGDGSGLHLVQRMRRENPRGVIVVLSEFATGTVAERCARFGAAASFRKSDTAAFISYFEAQVELLRHCRHH